LNKIEGYLNPLMTKKSTTSNIKSFYQYVLSLRKKASPKSLSELYNVRDTLSLMGKVFLLRAIKNQTQNQPMISLLLEEFNNSLQVEADFAYFDAPGPYFSDMPFYSSRYATALLLQAILEVKGEYFLAPRIMNWLLEAKPYSWNTTHTNFWVLYAMNEYVRQVEKTGTKFAEIQILREYHKKRFENDQDLFKLEKDLNSQKEPFDLQVQSDSMVYLTTELTYKLKNAPSKSRGITVSRNVYNKKGKLVKTLIKGDIYQVELLIETDKQVPYAVIDEPLAAGFGIIRQDTITARSLNEFNRDYQKGRHTPWLRKEHSADRIIFYSYMLKGKIRVVYFIKALYKGEFTWLPTLVQAMYHPQYFGRTAFQTVKIDQN
jgi:uncharacterized protein YfaS (alpha-2-macroglobulin family)